VFPFAASAAVKPVGGISPTILSDKRYKDDLRRAVAEEGASGVATVLEKYGFRPLTSTSTHERVSSANRLTPLSSSTPGDIAITNVSITQNNQGRIMASGYWEWRQDEYDWNDGTYDTVSLHFVTPSGTKPAGIKWKSGTGSLFIYSEGGETNCEDGWIHKYDFAGGGIIFNFQDHSWWRYFSRNRYNMCGALGVVQAELEALPEPPYHLVMSYEHTWNGGAFDSASISAGTNGLSLGVTYSDYPHRWQLQRMRRFDYPQ
jgi:hypothetical protein